MYLGKFFYYIPAPDLMTYLGKFNFSVDNFVFAFMLPFSMLFFFTSYDGLQVIVNSSFQL